MQINNEYNKEVTELKGEEKSSLFSLIWKIPEQFLVYINCTNLNLTLNEQNIDY